jgi:hypothetical protein
MVSGLAGKHGLNLNGRKINVGQFADRQAEVPCYTKKRDSDHHKRRHDRALDEDFSNVHRAMRKGDTAVPSFLVFADLVVNPIILIGLVVPP